MHVTAEVYDIFESTFKSKDNAKKVMNVLEEVIVTTVHNSWYKTKEELKGEVLSHFATKQDLEQVHNQLSSEIKNVRVELLGKFDALYEKTEKDKAELLGIIKQDKAELIGMIKQDKAELLGILQQNKTELLGILQQNKAELLGILQQNKAELLGIIKSNKEELLGKIESLYEKTEKDKAELIGMIKQDKTELLGVIKTNKEELLGKIEALYQKTEKDKAEMLLKFEKMDKKFSIYFTLLLFTIIFLNQNALEFIAKIIGLVK